MKSDAAATGSLNIPALFLFAIIFFWTPPHFWALALVRRKDYARGHVPMLPVVAGGTVLGIANLIDPEDHKSRQALEDEKKKSVLDLLS